MHPYKEAEWYVRTLGTYAVYRMLCVAPMVVPECKIFRLLNNYEVLYELIKCDCELYVELICPYGF